MRVSRRWLVVGIAAWFVLVIGSVGLLWRYKSTPGESAASPASWPVASAIRPVAGVANIVMFAHPQCPCTKASMTELANLAAATGAAAQIHIVLVHPDGAPDDFEDGAIRDRARAIPNAKIIVDRDGVESERFGARVSGSTVVYDAQGRLAFHGGLTIARGHEGHGPAFDQIVALVHGGAESVVAAPTFGCAIRNSGVAAR